MKITGVSSTLFQHTMPRRMGDANSPMGRARSSGCIIELHTDTELTGITTGGGAAIGIINSLVEGVLIGQDPRQVTGLWQRMVNKHFKGGHDGIANDAISALDIALWDLKAKYNDEPLWKTLGGIKQPVNAYASGLDMPLSEDTRYSASIAAWRKNTVSRMASSRSDSTKTSTSTASAS